MRLVHVSHDDPHVLEVTWMWLPAFISGNHPLLFKLGQDLNQKFGGREVTELLLDKINEYVLDQLQAMFNILGLREYLAGMRHVRQEDESDQTAG